MAASPLSSFKYAYEHEYGADDDGNDTSKEADRREGHERQTDDTAGNQADGELSARLMDDSIVFAKFPPIRLH